MLEHPQFVHKSDLWETHQWKLDRMKEKITAQDKKETDKLGLSAGKTQEVREIDWVE